MIVNDEAIILNSRKYGDTSKIVSLFSKEQGRLSVLAKAARQPKNKFGSALEPLSYCSITFYKKPQRDLHLLSRAELVIPLRKIQDSIERLSAGLMIIESILQTQEEDVPNPELFSILLNAVLLLNESESEPFSIFLAFQLKLAELLGFEISLNSELINKNMDENSRTYLFSLENGGLIDSNIIYGNNSYIFEEALFEIFKKLLDNSLKDASLIKINEKYQDRIISFIIRYFSYHLEKRFSFRSYNFVKGDS